MQRVGTLHVDQWYGHPGKAMGLFFFVSFRVLVYVPVKCCIETKCIPSVSPKEMTLLHERYVGPQHRE